MTEAVLPVNTRQVPTPTTGDALSLRAAIDCAVVLVPTMDLASWGGRQHDLHARLGPVRAAEYGVPVVRVCSSGVSQIVSADGTVTATAGFPGQREMVAGRIAIQPGRLPIDRWPAPACTGMTGGWVLALLVLKVRARYRGHRIQ